MTPTDKTLTPEGGEKKEDRVVISKPHYKMLFEESEKKRKLATILLGSAVTILFLATALYIGSLVYLVNHLK